jgi:hypothetical protein
MEGKVIDINKYKNNVMNSPLLSGDVVEVKDYSISNKTVNNPGAAVKANPVTQVQNQQRVEVNKNFSFQYPAGDGVKTDGYLSHENVHQSFGAPEMPPPPIGEINDNIDQMQFSETAQDPNELQQKQEDLSQSASLESAAMLINLYSGIVPPLIANTLKTNVMDFGNILKGNTQIPNTKVTEIQRFLLLKNEEIEKALKLSREQTMLLKHALADVLKRYNLQPENPVVNLLIVIVGIGVSQFMAIRQIMAAQQEYLINFIEQFSVTIPEGTGNPLLKKVRLQVKKRKDYSEAA